jgi:hypothetical protein
MPSICLKSHPRGDYGDDQQLSHKDHNKGNAMALARLTRSRFAIDNVLTCLIRP